MREHTAELPFEDYDEDSHFIQEEIPQKVQEILKALAKLKDSDAKGRGFLDGVLTELKKIPNFHQDEEFIICDGANDHGVDAFRIIQIEEELENGEIDITFDIEMYQMKYGTAHTMGGCENDLHKTRKLLRKPAKIKGNQGLEPLIEMLKEKKSIREVRYFYITDNNDLIEHREKLKLFVQKNFKIENRLYNHSIDYLFLTLSEVMSFQFPANFSMEIDVTPDKCRTKYTSLITDKLDVYIVFAKVKDLAEAWDSVPGGFPFINGYNCRTFMGYNKPANAGITHTLEHEPEMYPVYSLGMYFSCKDLKIEDRDGHSFMKLVGAACHNGGQNGNCIDKMVNILRKPPEAYVSFTVVRKKNMSAEEEEKMNIYTNHSTAQRTSAWASQKTEVKQFARNMMEYDVKVQLREGNSKKIKRKGIWYDGTSGWINVSRLTMHKNMYATLTQKLHTARDEKNFGPYEIAFDHLGREFEGFDSDAMTSLGVLVAHQHAERIKRKLGGSEALWHSLCGHLLRTYLLTTVRNKVSSDISFADEAKDLVLSQKQKDKDNVTKIYNLVERGFENYSGKDSDGIWRQEDVKKCSNTSLTGVLNQHAEDYCSQNYAGKLQILNEQMLSINALMRRKKGDLEAIMKEIENNEDYYMFSETTEEAR